MSATGGMYKSYKIGRQTDPWGGQNEDSFSAFTVDEDKVEISRKDNGNFKENVTLNVNEIISMSLLFRLVHDVRYAQTVLKLVRVFPTIPTLVRVFLCPCVLSISRANAHMFHMG